MPNQNSSEDTNMNTVATTNVVKPVQPVPTRTMASDAKRADLIEAERNKASKAAIAEIKELEKALAQATDQLQSNSNSSKVELDTNQPETADPITNTETVTDKIVKDFTINQPMATYEAKEMEPEIRIAADEVLVMANESTTNTNDSPDNGAGDDSDAKHNDTGDKNTKDTDQKQSGVASDDLITVIDEQPQTVAESDEDIRVSTLKKEVAKQEKAKLDHTQKRSQFTKQEQPIRKEIEEIKVKLSVAEKSLEPFVAQENALEAQIAKVEQVEKTTESASEKHTIENSRWQLEDKRHEIEQKKWDKSREVEQIAADLKTKEADLEKILQDAKSIDEAIAAADKRIKELDLEIKLVELSDTKEELETKWVALNEKKRSAETKLDETKGSESLIEEQIEQLHKNTIQTSDLAVRREFEQERHRISLERRDLEKKRWELEQDLRDFAKQLDSLKPAYQKALDDESRMKDELENIKTGAQKTSSAGQVLNS